MQPRQHFIALKRWMIGSTLILGGVLAGAGMVGAAWAESETNAGSEEVWIADQKSGCSTHNAFPEKGKREAITWMGECDKNGKLSGSGRLLWYVDDQLIGTFEGTFTRGKRNGKGICRLANGDVYDGDFVDGKKQGKGVFKLGNGDLYRGDFLNDRRHGRGVLQFANGDRYDGEFIHNQMSGQGIYRWANGNQYQGRFEQGQIVQETP